MLRASPAVHMQKYSSHSSLIMYFFPTPFHKTKTGSANWWETSNSKPPGLIIMIGQSGTGSCSQITFITLFSSRHCYPFYQPQQTVQKYWAKTILLTQTSMFWLFFHLTAGSHTEHGWSCSENSIFMLSVRVLPWCPLQFLSLGFLCNKC